jgi:threonine synthase
VTLFEGGSINRGNALAQSVLSRYKAFFPFETLDPKVSLGEGMTPLVSSSALAARAGISRMFLKNESQNPTWSFKDRGTVAGVQHALKLGIRRIGTVSTGNMAPSVAAYGSRAGLETFVLVNDSIPKEKLSPIGIYGAHLIKVAGDYGRLYHESLRIGQEQDIYFINSDAPMRVEGSKTIAFEICEQLAFDMPDFVVVPTSAGGNLRGIAKGFREFLRAGLIHRLPRMVAAQAGGCSPIVKAFEGGRLEISREEAPRTIAHAIENPLPPSGNEVLRILRKEEGLAVSVTEASILEAQSTLAKEGFFVQPASAVGYAAVLKLAEAGTIKKEDRVVVILTGSGLKYTAALDRHTLEEETCALENLGDHLLKYRGL